MIRIPIYLSILLFTSCTPELFQASKVLVINNIDIVDVKNGQIIENQNVMIIDSLIEFIAYEQKHLKAKNYTIIDGKGLYIMPGLWDMHFHGCWDYSIDSIVFPALLKLGITGIRDMGGELSIQNLWKYKIESNPSAGPNIFGAGPMIDGNPPVWQDFSIAVNDQTDIKLVLDSMFLMGSDFIKTYSLIQESELREIASYVKQKDKSFAGHLSEYIEPETSISLGQKSIEHLNRLDDISMNNPLRLDSLIRLMHTQGTWLCPSLITYYIKANMDHVDFNKNQWNKYIPNSLFDEWELSRVKRMANKDSLYWHNQKKKFEHQKKLVKYLSDAGVPILIGSDFGGMPFVYPGIGVYEELALLKDAGLSNQEIIKACTYYPALYFNIQEKFGSVEVGKYADLIILDQNPFTNINFSANILSVYRKGLLVK